jgi:hypothetical protein
MLPRTKGKAASLQGTEYSDRLEGKIIKMPGQLGDWQIKCVCGGTNATCNNGWMRKIEDAARPILIPLILGQQTRISHDDQSIISTWAVLKSMIADYDNGSNGTVHHMQRKYIMRKSSPPTIGWGVWIGHYERKNWVPEWISRPFLLLHEKHAAKRSSRNATYFNSNVSTQIIGKLFVHVMHSPMPGLIKRWRFPPPQKGSLFRIWPQGQFSIKWPSSALTDVDADRISDAFAAFLIECGRPRVAQGIPPP